ncbi:hypothetical protein SRHO_G00295950 [Serrasalmus rhombeus]
MQRACKLQVCGLALSEWSNPCLREFFLEKVKRFLESEFSGLGLCLIKPDPDDGSRALLERLSRCHLSTFRGMCLGSDVVSAMNLSCRHLVV